LEPADRSDAGPLARVPPNFRTQHQWQVGGRRLPPLRDMADRPLTRVSAGNIVPGKVKKTSSTQSTSSRGPGRPAGGEREYSLSTLTPNTEGPSLLELRKELAACRRAVLDSRRELAEKDAQIDTFCAELEQESPSPPLCRKDVYGSRVLDCTYIRACFVLNFGSLTSSLPKPGCEEAERAQHTTFRTSQPPLSEAS
jgi:hypothetical protein